MVRSPNCPPATWNRFWLKVNRQGPGGCWLWTAATSSNGYGCFGVNGRRYLAHRFAYELLVGPIPSGLTIDHVHDRGCRHRTCVNPDHLEPVTIAENNARKLERIIKQRREVPVLPAHRPSWVTETEWDEVVAFNAARRAAAS